MADASGSTGAIFPGGFLGPGPALDSRVPRRVAPRSVLIVDDDPCLLECLSAIVRETGRSTAVALDGRKALDVLAQLERPCLVLLDLIMPVMDGFEFLKALDGPDACGDVRVVVVSGWMAETPSHPRIIGELRKPFDIEALLPYL